MAAIFFQVKIFELRWDGEGWAGGFFCSEIFGVEDFVNLLSMKKLVLDFLSKNFFADFFMKIFFMGFCYSIFIYIIIL